MSSFLNSLKFENRELLTEMDILKLVHLPFAGIILFRFNGCDLSLTVYCEAPREMLDV
jgi:hypothetical protein